MFCQHAVDMHNKLFCCVVLLKWTSNGAGLRTVSFRRLEKKAECIVSLLKEFEKSEFLAIGEKKVEWTSGGYIIGPSCIIVALGKK